MKQGFTLIELLVVVLIIGILAAVAVPQYKMAVDKTNLIKLLPLARAIHNAQEAFWLANGRYATTWDELGFDLPAFLSVSGRNAYSYYGEQNLRITLYGQEYFGIGPYKPDFLFVWAYDQFPGSGAGRISCYAYNAYAEKLRRKVCKEDGRSTLVPWAFIP